MTGAEKERERKRVWYLAHREEHLASFDMADPVQQKECFHFSNLQPLWAEDNRRKSDSWVDAESDSATYRLR